MEKFELINQPHASPGPEPSGWESLGNTLLLQNALWFVRIRWVAVAMAALFGFANVLADGWLLRLGLEPQPLWPWLISAVLLVSNVTYAVLLRRIDGRSERSLVTANIWLQIVVDLFVLTVVAHMLGATDTFISFAYVFHVVLACVFFTPRDSLRVTFVAALLYLGCVTLELCGVLPVRSVFVNGSGTYPAQFWPSVVVSASAVFVWFVVWYLVSTISKTLRRRDQQLALANERLLTADQEKNRRVLRTTHDLKAPFAGIESNIQLLQSHHAGELPPPVREIINRIQARAETLRCRINDIMVLGELRSEDGLRRESGLVDLHGLLEDIVAELEDKMLLRKLSLKMTVPEMRIMGSQRQYHILFANLLSNAVTYSLEGGVIEVGGEARSDAFVVTVRDYGIGIKASALPKIFEEYFRTQEAADFNPLSTGLGLAIVKQVAQNLDLRITVESGPGEGTVFSVVIPKKEGQ